jgi:hypothetical protein
MIYTNPAMFDIGPASSNARLGLMTAIQKAGLTGSLKLALDAGDDASYPSGGAKWLDRSGGGFDFFRGTTASSEATDPTFNGVAGRFSANEYFSFDGGDYFVYDTAMEQWMKDLHKTNRALTLISVAYIPTDATTPIYSTRLTIGMDHAYSATGNRFQYQFTLASGGFIGVGGGAPTNVDTLLPGPFIAGYAGPNLDGGFHNSMLDGIANNPITIGATGPFSSTDPDGTNFHIGAFGDGRLPAQAGTRIYGFAIWQDRQFVASEFRAFFNIVRGKFSK